jgi:hypothetical protein
MATPEKALFDVFYLSATRQTLFKSLPELELSRGFKKKNLKIWCDEIKNPRLRAYVSNEIVKFFR